MIDPVLFHRAAEDGSSGLDLLERVSHGDTCACLLYTSVAKKGDEGKISSALARLMEEDPTLCYINNAETRCV